jgi:hypothetical protein
MRALAVLCNLVSVAFTLFVMATDGPPTTPIYFVFSALLLLVPALTMFALVRGGTGRGWLGAKAAPAGGAALARAAAVCNMALVAFIGWALVDQHPHPSEKGFVAYVVMMLATPTLSAAVLLWSVRGRSGEAPG